MRLHLHLTNDGIVASLSPACTGCAGHVGSPTIRSALSGSQLAGMSRLITERRAAWARAWSRARALYGLLPHRLRRLWALLVVLTGLCSLAELATTALLFSVIRLATQPAEAGPRGLLPWGSGTFLLVGAKAALLATALTAAVFVLRTVLAFSLTATTSSASVKTGIFIAETLLRQYVSMPYAAFRQHPVAELQRRVTIVAMTAVSMVFRPGVQLVTDAAVIASILLVMVLASPWATVAAAGLVAGVSVLLIGAVNPRLHEASRVIERRERSANLFVDQVLRGRREITLRHHEAP